MNVPTSVGVPLIVIVLLFQLAVTPAGRPVGAPMPVALVVVCVIFGEIAVFTHKVGVDDAADTVFVKFTFIVSDLLVPEHVLVLSV